MRGGYQLPVSVSYEACHVDVTVPEGRSDLSNWSAVRFAANQVIAACAVGDYPYGSTGGFTGIGRNVDSRVTIRTPPSVEDDLGGCVGNVMITNIGQ